jgi:hypothetical protein
MSEPQERGLVVPVDIAAYCVGTIDARGPVYDLAGASTDYRNQTPGSRPAFLGINVTRPASFAPVWPLESGVHVHWAMPDALTHGDTSSGQLAFPALPNRWLVTRVVGDGQSSKHWIIRSDELATAPPDGKPAPTVPVGVPGGGEGAAADRGYRYLGAWEVYTPEWAEPAAAGRTLAAMTGAELHAVETGDIAFAAFYPNSRSSFGFRDDLADLGTGPAALMYVVTGWYDTPGNDPVHAGLTVTELQERLGWTVSSGSGGSGSGGSEDRVIGERVTYSTYSGSVQGIDWDPATRYLADEAEPIPGDVAIGNHPAEALAAYFRGTNFPDLPAFEELLTLYITGLMPDLLTPKAGQLASLEETLHELQFTGLDGGTAYTIMRGANEVGDLSLPLADALNLLNLRQQAADAAAAQVREGKWQLFATWYRAFEVMAEHENEALEAFNAQLRLLPNINERKASTARAAAEQKAVVEQLLSGDLTLTPVPAGRYYTANEPVVLLAGAAAEPSLRYGGDGRYHPAGYLVCRLAADVLRALTVGDATLRAAQFAALAPAAPNHLPHPEIAALVLEAALLDTVIDAVASGVPERELAADLAAWLADDGRVRYYGHPVGVPPSAVAVSAWPGANPWTSLTLLWDAFFHPLLSTVANGALVDYQPDFFTANYRLDPDSPRMIAYDPSADGIKIDPAKIDFTPGGSSGTARYPGESVLSAAAADNLREQLAKYNPETMDPTLRAIADQLARTNIAMQGLTGFNDEVLTRQAILQLQIGAGPSAGLPFRLITQQATREITSLTEIPPLAPQFNGDYSGVRAGYMKLGLQVMDPFGRKRPVRVGKLYIADSLTARVGDKTAAGIIYAQPRVAQDSRLQYHWLAADSTGYDEINSHPATTPVCGWLLPEHLSVGFFLYSAQGNPLGSLTLRADGSGIVWQSAPGDRDTIDADLVTVMEHQNPQLRELALVLGGAAMTPPLEGSLSPAALRAFWQAADTAITQIVPTAPASSAGLAALVGRPLAIVQASLRLERRGLAALDQSLSTLARGTYVATDHAVGGVGFPVVLGGLHRLDDGLVGYFRPSADGGYNTETFFSQAATGSDPRVTVPSPTNLLLRPEATPADAPDTPPAETKLLMLVDPRAAVHATMGIVPTQQLTIPPELYEDILAGLELTFPVFPLLRAAGGLAVPVPAITGSDWSWITEQSTESGPAWDVDPELRPITAGALWQYSPQTLTEGWLRLNPQLLEFRLTGAGGAPVVTAGTLTSLDLSITNKRGVPITFAPAAAAQAAPGSFFYVHLGSLVDTDRVGSIRFSAPGWRFEVLTDAGHGTYWAASPDLGPVTLAPGEQLTMSLANVAVAAGSRAQARVYFDYYNLTGVDDGVDIAVLAILQPSAVRRA